MKYNAADCPICGAQPEVWHTRTVSCPDCYDGAPDAGPQLCGQAWGGTAEAVADWNEQVADYLAEQEELAWKERG